MKKTLRLLVTEKCIRHCEGCVNKQINPSGIQSVEWFGGYDEIIITGGEPLLFPQNIISLIQNIRRTNYSAQIILYSASIFEIEQLINILYLIDGFTFTIHDEKGFNDLKRLNDILILHNFNISFRLNIPVIFQMSPIVLNYWRIKFFEFTDHCHLPEHETFLRLSVLW